MRISKMAKLRVLQVQDILGGGVASVMYNYAVCMKDIVCFDWFLPGLVDDNVQQEYDIKFSQLGSKIIKEKDFNKGGHVRRFLGMFLFFRKSEYKIIHINSGSPRRWKILLIAKLAGIPNRILHSHGTAFEDKKQEYKFHILYKFDQFLTRQFATDYFACSVEAGKFMFGETGIRTKKFRVIKNAIDIDKFRYNEAIRNTVRKECDLQDAIIVVGFVGRLISIKNPLYVIDVFCEFHKIFPKSVLWIVGDGEMKLELMNKVKMNELVSFVKFWGTRDDVSNLMMSMDILLVPSIAEGLGMVIIEAQASGLPCIVSQSVPKEVKCTNLVSFFPLDVNPKEWAKDIVKCINETTDRHINSLPKGNYNIFENASILCDIYMKKLM